MRDVVVYPETEGAWGWGFGSGGSYCKLWMSEREFLVVTGEVEGDVDGWETLCCGFLCRI